MPPPGSPRPPSPRRTPGPLGLVPREEQFTSRLHHERLAARLGLALGIAFGLAFVTGLLSHYLQNPPGWFWWPTRPVQLYGITQAVHITSGVASVPLLLAKLWTVYPRLFTRPPVRSVLHAVERVSVLVLIAAALFQLVTGVQNMVSWYPWGFSFPAAHFAMAWVAIGALVVHVGVQLPAIRRGLGADVDGTVPDGEPTRRGVLLAALAGAGVAVLSVAGQSVPGLGRISVLSPRSGDGPQGMPVTKSAQSAGVTETAVDPAWRLTVTGPTGSTTLSLDDLRAMPQTTANLPIACVQGWRETGTWTGVRVRDVLALVGAEPGQGDVQVESLQQGGAYPSSRLPARHAADDLTLLALQLAGEDLHIDHGYPCRLVAPSRPGVTQTKWLTSLEVLA